jgi:large-conductance mechanosensitive channel
VRARLSFEFYVFEILVLSFHSVAGVAVSRRTRNSKIETQKTQHVASLKEASDKGIPVFAYGMFINTVIEFLIIAFCLFIVIKQVNRFKKPIVAAASGPSAEEKLLTKIRDLLKNGTASLI